MNTATKQNEPKIRWIITGTLTTTSALHIGSGASELDERLAHDPAETDSQQGMASLVVRDHRGKPYLPGSAIKGVLRHYAEACGATAAQTIFGEHGKTHADHHAGFVDFLPAYLTSAPEEKQRCDEGMAWYTKKEATGLIAASARERTTRAVAAQKLFHYEAVPDGAVFDVTLHAEGLSKEEVSQLLSLLQAFTGKAESLSLGAKQATGLGVMTWEKGSVKYLSPEKAKQWWHGVRFGFAKRFDEPSPDKAKELWKASIGVEIKPWEEEEYAVDSDVQATPLAPAANRKPITFATTITIDGPFLVSEPAHKGGGNELEGGGNEPDFMPRHTHDGMIELPGGSLHGALRAQAERICRTLGLEVPEGHLAPVYDAKKPENQDIVSWLFGAPGWRSVLRMGRFTALAAPLHEQDFVAIDRFHGGVSGSAKFKGQSVLNPSLAGDLSVDTHRLKVSIDPDAALGLLALTLRDLDDGDIPLGYGAASKGFGQVDTAKTKTLETLSIELQKLNITVDDKVEAFRVYCESKVTKMPTVQTQPLTTAKSPVEPLAINTPAQGDFHNPYAFLPVDKPKDKHSWKSRTDFDERNLGHHSHDRYALSDAEGKPVYSGRIVCSLKNKTPLVVGGKQTKGTPNIVEPFKLGNQIALPATSLRGMIGAIIEAASQSSMRVLEDRQLSTRRLINDKPLSAMGRVVKYNGELRLEPLCLPTLEFPQGNTGTNIPTEFRLMFPDGQYTPFKALFADQRNGDANQVAARDQFFSNHASYPAGELKSFFLPVPAIVIKDGSIDVGAILNRLHIKKGIGNRPSHILGVCVPKNLLPLTAAEAKCKDEADLTFKTLGYKRGVIRFMHSVVRKRELPRPRKHEVWLPMAKDQMETPTIFPDGTEREPERQEKFNQHYKARTFPIDALAIERFEALADERTESQDNKDDASQNPQGLTPDGILPFHPIGTKRNAGDVRSSRKTFKNVDRALRIKPGDIVYFRPSNDGKSVAEIAFSSIWRSRIEENSMPYSVHTFFRSIDSELLPFNPTRDKISPAEWLLGFVSADKKSDNSGDRSAKVSAFAGKLRVSFGHLTQPKADNLLSEVTLKILSSPKPPSPAMYFKPRNDNGAYVSKPELAHSPQNYRPNGRKVHLHALRENNVLKGLSNVGLSESFVVGQNEPWRSRNNANDNQKVQVTPIKEGTEFWFHVDFDNLDQQELELLCFALQPCDKYEQRLGMGKPLGLGSVSVVPEALLLVDRAARYCSDACAPGTHRYHAVWQNPARNSSNHPPERYCAALEAINATGYTKPASISDLANAGAVQVKNLSEALWRAIILTGLPSAVTKPVHTPQMENENIEDRTFRWFGHNDGNGHQHLAPFKNSSDTLPALNRPSYPPSRKK